MKKWLAVILTVVMLMSVCPLTALAAERKKGEADPTKPPVILIDGINASPLIRDMGEKDEKEAFPFSADDVLALVRDNASAIWDMLDGDFSAESEQAVLDAVAGLLEDISMNDDGTPKYDLDVDWVYPGQERPRYEEDGGGENKISLDDLKAWFSSLFHRSAEELTEEEIREKLLKSRSTYHFCYDWRLDMFEIADRLKAYVDYIKEFTGYDTVSLVGFSEGAAVLNTYLTVYGYEGLDAVIWCSGAQNGVEFVGQAFTGRIRVDAAALTDYVRESGDGSVTAEMLSCFMDALRDIGVTGNVLNYTNNIIGALLADGGMRAILRGTMAKMPAIWCLISDKYYEEAKAYIFNEPDDAETYAALIQTIDRYHYGVQAHSNELMAQAKAQTGKIAVISKYGLRVTPLIENDRIQADGLLDVAATSCGATAAPYGETLGKDYVQAVADGHNHLSPDGVIDASTALYPEYTWFIKNLPHSTMPDDVFMLFYAIAYADGQLTVFDDPAYPQFMQYEPIEGVCEPMTDGESPNFFMRALKRIKVFFMELIERVKSWFENE